MFILICSSLTQGQVKLWQFSWFYIRLSPGYIESLNELYNYTNTSSLDVIYKNLNDFQILAVWFRLPFVVCCLSVTIAKIIFPYWEKTISR